MKPEWGGSKLPDLQVTRPKGTSGKKEGCSGREEPQDTKNQGSKRIQNLEGSLEEEKGSQKGIETRPETRPEKKRREGSPEPSQIKWRLRPTFLASGGRKVSKKEEEVNQKKE